MFHSQVNCKCKTSTAVFDILIVQLLILCDIMAQSQWSNTCCNPFDQHNHSYKRKNLRQVTKWMCERAPSISMGSKICDNCRKKLAKIPTTSQVSSASELESESEFYADTSESLASLNQCLGEIGETPVSKRKLHQTKYPKQKIKKALQP